MTCGSWRASPRTDSSAPRAQPPLVPSYVFLPPTLLLSHSVSPFRFLSHSASTTLFSARFYPPLVLLPRKTRRIGQPRSTTTCCFSSTILLRILDYSLSLFIPSSRRSLLFILPRQTLMRIFAFSCCHTRRYPLCDDCACFFALVKNNNKKEKKRSTTYKVVQLWIYPMEFTAHFYYRFVAVIRRSHCSDEFVYRHPGLVIARISQSNV